MMYQMIQKKKRGEELTREEIDYFIRGFVSGSVRDYQASALLMAICLRHMSERETVFLTESMLFSGETVDLSSFGNRSVDKHSTGGVGDKTTLILGPIVAASGGVVAKMSGRGLGFTGGTVDKLEAIPGMKTALSPEEFLNISHSVGLCVTGQSKNLVPADQKLYALRDVTATVDSIPLIASSIMSKKLASGAKNIVLDVKFGSGAFMKTKEKAEKLADLMVRIGRRLGRNVCALVTDMDAPLGQAIGNSLEVQEAVAVLKGGGDSELRGICLSLSAHMISLCLKITYEEAMETVTETLDSGRAWEKMKEWILAQGGDPAVLDDPNGLPTARFQRKILSSEEGFLFSMDAERVGIAAGELGAGRKTKEDTIDFGAGIFLERKIGDFVRKGDCIAVLYASELQRLDRGEEIFLSSLTFSREQPKKNQKIAKTLY